MRWQRKAMVQRVVAALPEGLGHAAYYFLQRQFGDLRVSNPTIRLMAGVEVARRLAASGGTIQGARVLEIGTGHQLGLPMALWLCGASEVVTVDLNRYLKAALVREDIAYIRAHRQEVAALFHEVVPAGDLEGRLDELTRGERSLPRLLAMMNVHYRAPADAARLDFEPGRFDCHTSFTVLEHIEPTPLRETLREAGRLLGPRGLFVHYVDFSDHFAHSDPSISSIHFLRFTDKEWRRWAGNRFMYQNRLRIDEFQELFAAAGLRILASEPHLDGRALEELRHGFPLAEPYRAKAPEINATATAWIVAAPEAPRLEAEASGATAGENRMTRPRTAPWCALCSAADPRPVYQLHDGREITVVRCQACGFQFQWPPPPESYGREDYRQALSHIRLEQAWETQAAIFEQRLKSIQKYAPDLEDLSGRRVLDIGAGPAVFLRICQLRGARPIGLDFGVEGAVREDYGIEVVERSIEDPWWHEHYARSFDLITSFDVLEHLRQPVNLLREAARLLRPGGVLFLSTPCRDSAIEYFGDRLYRASGGRLHHLLSARYNRHHLQIFSSNEVRRLAVNAQLQEIVTQVRADYSCETWLYLNKYLVPHRPTARALGALLAPVRALLPLSNKVYLFARAAGPAGPRPADGPQNSV